MRTFLLLITLFALQACVANPPQVTEAQARQAVLNWLECDECWHRELHHVVVLGKAQVGAILQEYASNPEITPEANLRSQLAARYNRLEDHANDRGFALSLTSRQYIDSHVYAERTRIQSRAVSALEKVARSLVPDGLIFWNGERVAITR